MPAVIKLQFLLWSTAERRHPVFAAQVMEELAPELLATGLSGLKLTLTVESPPRLSVIPFARRPVALVSVESADASVTAELTALCRRDGFRLGGYRVVESTPVAYGRLWPDGEETPGVVLLTLFNRRAGLSDEVFIERWHGSHTPLSLRIHPLWNYVRNRVEEPVVDDSPAFDAIVEEHFREPSDLMNPLRFFGGPVHMWPNMVRVLWDVRRFIDMGTMETYLVREHHLRSS